MSTQVRLFVTSSEANAHRAEAILAPEFDEKGYPVAMFEVTPDSPQWTVSVYVGADEADSMLKRINELLNHAGLNLSAEIETLGDVNWVAETLEALSPVRSGRFIVHGSHDRHVPQPHHHAVEIDAGLAFGTGHHGTTAGCLDMLGESLKRERFFNALDLGTGTGVLAIAAAKAGIRRVLATDIDPVATLTAHQNSKLNGTADFVKCVTATGFNHVAIRKRGPYDLIIANILARPLEKIAHDMGRHAAAESTIILSGLLPHQKARIIAAYRAQGFYFERAHYRDGWLVLVLKSVRRNMI